MARIVITGAAGFIGSHVTDLLIERGHEILALDNLSVGRLEQLNKKADFWKVDLGEVEFDSLATRIKDVAPKYVIHLAAIHFIPYCMAHPEETFSSNTRSTEVLVRAIGATQSVERLVVASTMDVYEPSDSVHHETDMPSPRNVYGLSKLLTENITRYAAATIDQLSGIGLRFANVYGPRETNPHLIPDTLERIQDPLASEIRMGNLASSRDFIHVSDIAEAVVMMTTYPCKSFDVFNLGSGTETPVRKVVQLIQDAAGDDRPIIEDVAKFRKFDRNSLAPSIEKVLEQSVWRPKVQIDDGLRTLVQETLSMERTAGLQDSGTPRS